MYDPLKLLEYLVQKDGSVVCKWCGEVLPSRSRWYRHKYKLHVQTSASIQQQQPPTQAQVGCIQPAPLFKCQSCNAYFKSRKGYIGHLSSRHSGEDVPENDENREEACNANKTSAAINKTQISHQKKITHVSSLMDSSLPARIFNISHCICFFNVVTVQSSLTECHKCLIL